MKRSHQYCLIHFCIKPNERGTSRAFRLKDGTDRVLDTLLSFLKSRHYSKLGNFSVNRLPIIRTLQNWPTNSFWPKGERPIFAPVRTNGQGYSSVYFKTSDLSGRAVYGVGHLGLQLRICVYCVLCT